ncbi:MAG: type II toxin-antitoxin system HicA family toxin [Verrucomicrobia bacterium]|nr:type II toxin-antitoxin system HicA family toxin [Verrucomicrobiota bacterium]
MPTWNPCKRRDFVRKLRRLGFEGPFPANTHEFMVIAGRRQTIPGNAEFSVLQLRMMLRQIDGRVGRSISLEEWESL